ncbi:ABC transporter, periplasmic binding protein [Bartonella clarridgeiae 73]|uniref:ABC transporter, periplasmic binding protein n=1 Tax=Bartonella clarridgeiae (strain CCUG 45776 / CIP 104772 / 73) TaxID=696125 RepID=E6YIS1_BARC7|nr:zinc ABC transporter substrate-binding protein [Bartonella clarridgeiae]WCR54674.1 MAG: Zinc ABC transporter substrate-binding protein ZnuA [Bartonella clarridgeiae]CBI76759.1 ABC transporter, periplasmic binding protein [Bartonella clarridgeiae 73]
MHKFVKQFVLLNSLLLPLFPLSVTAHQKINVVASFSILADLVKNVGGDHISITTLVGPNTSIHSYELTPRDAKTLKNAHIIFINGLYLEGFMNRLTTVTGTKALLVEVSANISPFEIKHQKHNRMTHYHGSVDPHAWHTIPNVEIYVKNIAIAFCKIDQQSCENYNKNAHIYIQKLKAMHATIAKKMSTLPKEKRTIITSHDAFGYFAHEYDLTILAPESVSKEATAADVAKLIKQIKNNKVSGLFIENISNPRLTEQISKETGLKIGGILYSDALSEKEGPAATYLDMMEYNVNTIINAISKH